MKQQLAARDEGFKRLSAEYNELQACIVRSIKARDDLAKKIFLAYFKQGYQIYDRNTHYTYTVKRVEFSKRHNQWALCCSTYNKGAPLKVTLDTLISRFDF